MGDMRLAARGQYVASFNRWADDEMVSRKMIAEIAVGRSEKRGPKESEFRGDAGEMVGSDARKVVGRDAKEEVAGLGLGVEWGSR